MTENEWLTATDPRILVRLTSKRRKDLVRTKAGRRKVRLFGCASCRLLWEKMTDPRSRAAVEMAERLADGLVSYAEADVVGEDADAAATLLWQKQFLFSEREREAVLATGWLPGDEGRAAAAAAHLLSRHWVNFIGPIFYALVEQMPEYPIFFRRRSWEAKLVRCIFGNPFRPVTVDTAWLSWNGATVPRLAAAIYDERAFDRLPVLADALEESGCRDADMLAHLRGSEPHVRGCWVVDLLLGKG